MAPVIRIDEKVMNELKKRAIELDMVFNTPNEVLRSVLGLTRVQPGSTVSEQRPSMITHLPTSNDPGVQRLLDGILQGISDLHNGFRLSQSGKWIAFPNFVAIKIQDARAHNLAVTVYGGPDDFRNLQSNLRIEPDRSGYSRFNIDREDQLPSVIRVIRRAHQLKMERGRQS